MATAGLEARDGDSKATRRVTGRPLDWSRGASWEKRATWVGGADCPATSESQLNYLGLMGKGEDAGDHRAGVGQSDRHFCSDRWREKEPVGPHVCSCVPPSLAEPMCGRARGTAASQENNGFATPRNPQLGGAGGPDEKAVTAHCGVSEDSSRRSASGGQSMGR